MNLLVYKFNVGKELWECKQSLQSFFTHYYLSEKNNLIESFINFLNEGNTIVWFLFHPELAHNQSFHEHTTKDRSLNEYVKSKYQVRTNF